MVGIEITNVGFRNHNQISRVQENFQESKFQTIKLHFECGRHVKRGFSVERLFDLVHKVTSASTDRHVFFPQPVTTTSFLHSSVSEVRQALRCVQLSFALVLEVLLRHSGLQALRLSTEVNSFIYISSIEKQKPVKMVYKQLLPRSAKAHQHNTGIKRRMQYGCFTRRILQTQIEYHRCSFLEITSFHCCRFCFPATSPGFQRNKALGFYIPQKQECSSDLEETMRKLCK